MEEILDFSKPVDVQQFDAVVQVLSGGNPADIMRAQEILTQFKERPESFFRVDKLLTESTNVATRFFALQVLDDNIIKMWNSLTIENQQAVRNFIIGLITNECRSFDHIRRNKPLLTKMNSTLVSIAKREWPLRWPNFIQDICTSATLDVPMVENNLNLLRLVGEEVFQFGEKTLTSRWRERKRHALAGDAVYIMNLCSSVLLGTEDTLLLKAALQTLEAYIPWMAPSLVFHEATLSRIAAFVVGDENVRTSAIRCITEVCSLKRDPGAAGDEQTQFILRTFRAALENIFSALPTQHSSLTERTVQLYEQGSVVDQTFVQNLNLLLIAFLQNYYTYISYDDLLLVSTHELLLGMSNIYEKELFKACVEYWWWLGDWMIRAPASTVKKNMMSKLSRVLSDVRYVLIKRMAKPEEVIIVEEDGELRREHMTDVEELHMYQLMREALVFLTNLDPKDTRNIMVNLMQRQLDRSEWSWHNCNTLSWAVGAISMAMSAEDEYELFVNIIKGLLVLCKEMQGRENRAVIASDIMFVVGQYPRFLRNHINFLFTVARKVFEFMREPFPGVKDMAVDTFFKLARLLPDKFVEAKNGPSFAMEVAREWTTITSMLALQQVQTCFAAVGCMIKAESVERQAELLFTFLKDVNNSFKRLTEQCAAVGTAFCGDASAMGELLHYLRIYSNIADTCGNAFIHQMDVIITDLYGFYRIFAEAQQVAVRNLGPAALLQHETRQPRLAKREILKIFERFVENTEQLDFVAANCMPDIFTVVLVDYEQSIQEGKEAGAMALAAACVRKLGTRLSGDCAAILDHTFNTTVGMITRDMESYPEFRVNLFRLLQAMNAYCFEAFLTYVAAHEDVLGGMLWAIKHTDYPTMSTTLDTLDRFLENVTQSSFAESFYTAYIQRIFVEVLVTAMDSLHSAGFPFHCKILMKLFRVTDPSVIRPQTPVLGRNAILEFLLSSLSVIPTLTPSSIEAFVNACYENSADEERFKVQFADFLIESQVWGAEQENKLQEDEERRLREAAIPGYAYNASGEPKTGFGA